MKVVSVFKRILARLNYSSRQMYKMMNDPVYTKSYYDEEPLKSKWSIITDHLTWLARHSEINKYYYIYGLDRKNGEVEKQILPYKTFRKIRDKKNLHPPGANFNYASLLRDKFIFGQFLTSLHFPTPKNIAMISDGKITWLDTMKTEPIESLSNLFNAHINGFCKKLMGQMGDGAFPLSVCGGKLISGDKHITIAELKSKMSGQYLWQEKIEQHETTAKLHPSSVNTIRVITFNVKGNIEVFSATFRVGAHNSRIDNWSAGGIAIGIDLETGKLRKKGVYKPGFGDAVYVHPDSGITFEGYRVPYFDDIIEMTKKLHHYFYGVHSVGWDIAITPNGPVFVEGNDDWDGAMPMAFEENFKNRFLKMYNP
jgi:hypothetical protein